MGSLRLKGTCALHRRPLRCSGETRRLYRCYGYHRLQPRLSAPRALLRTAVHARTRLCPNARSEPHDCCSSSSQGVYLLAALCQAELELVARARRAVKADSTGTRKFGRKCGAASQDRWEVHGSMLYLHPKDAWPDSMMRNQVDELTPQLAHTYQAGEITKAGCGHVGTSCTVDG